MENTDESLIDRLNIRSQEIRSVVLKPILEVLDKLGFTANRLTNLRLIMGFGFLVWIYFADDFFWPAIFILIVLFLDVFDGALARYQKKASDKGKFLDIFVDNAIYIFIILGFLKLGADPILVAYNIFIVPVAYLLAVIENQEFKPSDWIIKPYAKRTYLKIITLIPYFVFVFLDINWLKESLIIGNILATFTSLYSYFYIQIRWKRKS